MSRGSTVVGALSLTVLFPAALHADEQPLRAHATVGLTHAVGTPQSREFGLGGSGSASLELPVGRAVGIEAKLTGIVLLPGDAPLDPSIARAGTGTVLLATAGIRIRPVTTIAGLWSSAGFGFAQTGSRSRPGVDAALGWDFRIARSERWDVGPFVGYTQVVQPDDSFRPNDARMLTIGLHAGLGVRRPDRNDRDHDTIFDDEDACPDVPGIRTTDPATNGCPRPDRDHDGVFDDEDACGDVPGIRTTDPATNGCPRSDRDHDGVFDDEDACRDVPGIRTTDPATNGCPRPDRDGDGVYDDEDACPDLSGIRTLDPTTNGCPPAGPSVHVVKDKILLDEIILFDLDSPRIHHASWPIVQKLADFINATPEILEVSIEGHADATGTEQHNLVLSLARAESMRRLLVKFGVDPGRLKAEAFGRSRLKVQTDKAEIANRRVELWVTRTRTAPGAAPPAGPPPTSPLPSPAGP